MFCSTNETDLYKVFTFRYRIFCFTFTVLWSFRMEPPFIFFAFVDLFGWIDKSKKFKKAIHKNFNVRWKMKSDGRNQLLFNFDELTNVKNVRNHVTVCFSKVNKECFCLLLGFSFNFLSENKLVCFFNAKTKIRLLPYMLRHIECAFEKWNLNIKERISQVNVYYRKLCRGRKFRNSLQRKQKLKIENIILGILQS